MELMKTLAKELDETLGDHPTKTIILIVGNPHVLVGEIVIRI